MNQDELDGEAAFEHFSTTKQQYAQSLDLSTQASKKDLANTIQEETILEYVESFRRQFVQLFPQRRELLLSPLNEFGVRKFVCTSLRPTQLDYEETYDLDQTAKFVADFLKYTPFETPTTLPDLLPSIDTVLRLRQGDSLDMSNLLCSLLIGAGYDAHVVCGFAPYHLTLQDQTHQQCPLLTETRWTDDTDKRRHKNDKVAVPDRYLMTTRNAHKSKFLEYKAAQEAAKIASGQEHDTQAKEAARYSFEDPLVGRRVHCWVLVRAGKRGLGSDLFLDAATAQSWKVAESPFVAVESVWNNRNYWANVQDHVPIQELSVDLNDNSCWEYVLIEDSALSAVQSVQQEPAGLDSQADSNDNGHTNGARGRDGVSDVLGSDDDDNESGGQHNEGHKDGQALDDGEPHGNANLDDEVLTLPVSWVGRVGIDRESFIERFPGGFRKTYYKNCNLTQYAPYRHSKGLVAKLTLFSDQDRQVVSEIREVFQHRRDKLAKRVTFPKTATTKEEFLSGRQSGLQYYIQEAERKREFWFHPGSRIDGKFFRSEVVGVKVIEEFSNRDDFVMYRSIAAETDQDQTSGRRSKGFSISLGGGAECVIRKITEKYHRDSSKSSDHDVRKATFFIGQGKIRLDFHFGDDRVSASCRTYDKHGPDIDASGWQADPLSEAPVGAKLRQEYQNLLVKEKELMSQVRNHEHGSQDLRERLDKEHRQVPIDKTVYDRAREKAAASLSEEEQRARQQAGGGTADGTGLPEAGPLDYLSPFLAKFDVSALTRQQARQAKEECLRALKERLLERANIIQRRLNRETEALEKRRATFHRSQAAHLEKEQQEEDFARFHEETMFRIKILEERLARHEKLSLKKYAELNNKLKNDQRLAVLHY